MKKNQDIIEQVKKDKILLIPFDTVWGLAGDARNRGVAEKIFAIKKRPSQKPISILIPSLDYPLLDIYQIKTGPYTYLIKSKQKPKLSSFCYKKVKGAYLVGARHISSRYQVQKICSELNIPLTATSANLAGERPATNFKEAKKFYHQIPPRLRKDIILVNTKERVSGAPSKIIDLSGNQPKEYIRAIV